MSYSPHLRTAVLLSGNGTGGAYHAGVLRALHEAGVKVDVMSGRGVGIVGCLFAAIDAAAKTWEDGGIWRRRPVPRIYRWRQPLQLAGAFALAGVAVLAIPLLVLATALVAYPFSFLVQMISVDAGARLVSAYVGMVTTAFSPDMLPTVVPRLVTLCFATAFGVLAAAAILEKTEVAYDIGSRERGRWWARIIGSPWSTEPGVRHFRGAMWELFCGPAAAKEPTLFELSRRYADLLFENLGQPGFRELIVTTLDIEMRGDIVFAAIAEPRRQTFFQRHHGELIDLKGVGRSQVLDALAGGLSMPVITDPHLVVFSPESYWKGESHRTCDRIGAVPRLLDELLAAGVDQVIVVCPDADRSAPHRLSKPAGSLRSRVAEHLSAAETAAIRDAIGSYRKRFKGLFLIQPAHNPIGSLDFEGTYDERSDRYQSLGELMDRGYEDAYRQFIEPVVAGA